MKRLCIFCFYDSKGIVDKSVEYLLGELLLNSDRLVIVVNGNIEDNSKKILEAYSKDVVVRENAGYDAGAYKFAIFKYLKIEEIRQYEELILCNDTFIGPFVPLKDIFDTMAKRECDWWGINGVDWKFLPNIQSYFWVFNKSIIQEDKFFKYWQDNIDEHTHCLEDVYAQFETGLSYYLTQLEKKIYSVYVPENNCNIYTSVSTSIKKYGIPLIKKKALRNFSTSRDDIIDAIQYIHETNCYPVENIIDYIQRFCNVRITKEQISEYVIDKDNIKDNPFIELETTTEDVKKSIDKSKGFYIYGCGVWARKIYWNLCRDNSNFKGFLISDIEKFGHKQLYGFEVMQIDKANINKDTDIVLGVNKANAIDIVKKKIINMDSKNIISLFPKTISKMLS